MSASCENLSGELVLFPKLHTGFLLNFIICIHSESNADNLNNVRRDANRHFRNKKKAGQDYCTPQGAMTDENGKMVKS